jgi:LysM repeat protein
MGRKSSKMHKSLVTITIITCISIALLNYVKGTCAKEIQVFKEYTIQRGDTLWSIAADLNTKDIRKTIYDIRQKNGLDGALIIAGQTILVPEVE